VSYQIHLFLSTSNFLYNLKTHNIHYGTHCDDHERLYLHWTFGHVFATILSSIVFSPQSFLNIQLDLTCKLYQTLWFSAFGIIAFFSAYTHKSSYNGFITFIFPILHTYFCTFWTLYIFFLVWHLFSDLGCYIFPSQFWCVIDFDD